MEIISENLEDFEQELTKSSLAPLQKIDTNPENVEQGLAKLVLALIELLRRLMEQQAIRRVEAGSLSGEEIEKLGLTFLRLEEKMAELKAIFGLSEDDLNIDLGPLGNLF